MNIKPQLFSIFYLFLFLTLNSYLCLPPSALADTPIKRLVQKALVLSPQFQSAKILTSIQELKRQNSFFNLLPSLSLNGSSSFQNNQTLDLYKNPISLVGLNVKVPLYDNGQSWNSLNNSKIELEISKLKLNYAKQTLSWDIVQKYNTYLYSHQIFVSKSEQFEFLKKQAKSIQTQFEQGIKPKNDFLKVSTQIDRAKLDLESSKSSLFNAENDLKKTIGLSAQQSNLEIDLTHQDLQIDKTIELLEKTIKQSPRSFAHQIIQQQQNLINAQREQLKGSLYPKISLQGSASFKNQWSRFTSIQAQALNYDATINLEYPLWDFGITNRQTQIESANLDLQDLGLNQQKLETDFETQVLYNDLNRTKTLYQLSQNLLRSEEINFENSLSRYRAGKLSYLDFTNSFDSLLDSKLRWASAQNELFVSLAHILYNQGTLYESIIDETFIQ